MRSGSSPDDDGGRTHGMQRCGARAAAVAAATTIAVARRFASQPRATRQDCCTSGPTPRHLRTQVCLKHDLHHTSPETVSAHSLTPTGFFLGGFTRPEIAVDRSDMNTSSIPTVPADIHSPYEIRRSRTGQRFYVFISVTYLLFVGAVRSASARADVCFITKDLGSLQPDVTTSAYALSLLCSCVVTI